MGIAVAASDNLHPVQFWPIEKAGQLHSGNHAGMSVEEEYQRRKSGDPKVTANDEIRARNLGFDSAAHYHQSLTDHIRKHGLANPPTFRDDGDGDTMSSGHHRYGAARDLGWETMPMRPWSGGDSFSSRPVPGWDTKR